MDLLLVHSKVDNLDSPAGSAACTWEFGQWFDEGMLERCGDMTSWCLFKCVKLYIKSSTQKRSNYIAVFVTYFPNKDTYHKVVCKPRSFDYFYDPPEPPSWSSACLHVLCKFSWMEAMNVCQGLDMTLPVLRTREEIAYLVNLTQLAPPAQYGNQDQYHRLNIWPEQTATIYIGLYSLYSKRVSASLLFQVYFFSFELLKPCLRQGICSRDPLNG